MASDKPLILIVEDESGIAETLEYALSTDGFETVWCATAQSALVAMTRQIPSLAILDVGLPDLNGFDLFRRFRTLSAELPVIFLTARGDEIDRVVGLELGADDYIAKPFSPRELVARVRSILRRTARNSPVGQGLSGASLSGQAAPFQVEEGRRQITFYGQILELSRYEFGLLKTLVARPGHVFTRDTLLQLVWDEYTDSLDRTVDAHIKAVRAKLKAVAPQLEPIRTFRGVGYALATDLPAAYREEAN